MTETEAGKGRLARCGTLSPPHNPLYSLGPRQIEKTWYQGAVAFVFRGLQPAVNSGYVASAHWGPHTRVRGLWLRSPCRVGAPHPHHPRGRYLPVSTGSTICSKAP